MKPANPYCKVFWVAAVLLMFSPLVAGQAQQDQSISDRDIKIVHSEDLRFPRVAEVANVEGVVVVKAALDENGNVTSVVTISGNPLLLQLSINNALKWKFAPNPERAITIIYNYRLKGFCRANKESSGPSKLELPNFITITGCRRTVQE